MANYFVINNKFKPYSFDELIKPYQIYGQAYKEQEDTYNTLSQSSGALEGYINENDEQSWKTYSAFKEVLQKEANELATNGLSADLRRRLSGLKGRYFNQIVPIAASANRRLEAIKEFNNSPAGKSGTYIGRNPSDTSVDEWLGGKTPVLNGVDGNELAKYVKDEVAASSNRYYDFFHKRGYDIKKIGASQVEVDMIMQALRQNAEFDNTTDRGKYLNAILRDLRENIIKNAQDTFGYNRFLDINEETGEIRPTEDSNRFMNAVYHGIVSGIVGKETREVNQYDYAAYNARLKRDGKDGDNPDPNAGEQERVNTRDFVGSKSQAYQEYMEKGKGKASAILDAEGKVYAVSLPGGGTASNMLDVYRAYKALEKKYNEANKAALSVVPMAGMGDTGVVTGQAEEYSKARAAADELKAQLDDFKDQFGDRLMTDREYKKLKDLMGFKDDNFTISDINDAANRDINYLGYQISEYTIADAGGNPDLLKDIHKNLRTEIDRRGTTGIYKTEDGVTRDKPLTKEEVSRLYAAISRIALSPESILYDGNQSYLIVEVPRQEKTTNIAGEKKGKEEEGFTALIPIYYFMDQIREAANAFKDVYRSYVGKPIPGDREGLNTATNHAAAQMRTILNRNIAGRDSESTKNETR